MAGAAGVVGTPGVEAEAEAEVEAEVAAGGAGESAPSEKLDEAAADG